MCTNKGVMKAGGGGGGSGSGGASFRHYKVCHDTVNEFVVCVYAPRDEILFKTAK